MVIIDVKEARFERIANIMLYALLIWCGFCTLEVLNDTCGIGIDIAAWYSTARSIAYQIMYAFLVFALYISTPKTLVKYLFLWGLLALFASFWVWKQKNFGFTEVENAWIQTRGRSTHIIQGGTLIRYFSIYSDAANFGIGIASTAVALSDFWHYQQNQEAQDILFDYGISLCLGHVPFRHPYRYSLSDGGYDGIHILVKII